MPTSHDIPRARSPRARLPPLRRTSWRRATSTVTNPGPLLDEDLNTPNAMPALVNGMGGDLSIAIGNYLTARFARRLRAGAFRQLRRRAAFNAGTIGPEDVNGDWARMQTARCVAENGLVRMKTVLGTAFETNADTPRAYLYAGFANRFLGENVCEAVIDGGPVSRAASTSCAPKACSRAR